VYCLEVDILNIKCDGQITIIDSYVSFVMLCGSDHFVSQKICTFCDKLNRIVKVEGVLLVQVT